MKELVKYSNGCFKAITVIPLNEELCEEVNKELRDWETLEGKEIKMTLPLIEELFSRTKRENEEFLGQLVVNIDCPNLKEYLGDIVREIIEEIFYKENWEVYDYDTQYTEIEAR